LNGPFNPVKTASIESEIRKQFAVVLVPDDWSLFKQMAASVLREAAHLMKRDMRVDPELRLHARNCRKRLLIGIGVEFLLGAADPSQHAFMLLNPSCVSNRRTTGLALA